MNETGNLRNDSLDKSAKKRQRHGAFVVAALCLFLSCLFLGGTRAYAAGPLVYDETQTVETYSFAPNALYDSVKITNGAVVTIPGNVTTECAFLIDEGSTLIIKGNLTTSHYMNISTNGTLTVEGDYIQKAVDLVFYSGTMNVNGNIKFLENGGIQRTEADATINLDGDLIFDTSHGCTVNSGNGHWYNAGYWNVGGNVIMGTDIGWQYISNLNLTGNDKHIINMGENDRLRDLRLEGCNEIEVPSYLNGAKINNDIQIVTGTGTKFSGITISNNINATVNGDMAAIGDIWIDDNSKLTVNGSYAQSDGAFSSYGEVSVAGDCAFKQSGGISTYIGDSAIVRIGGSLTYDTSRGCTYSSGNGKWYNAATWYVAGDISTGTGIGALYFTKLHLTGDNKHVINMGENDRLGDLWLEGCNEIEVPSYLNGRINNDVQIVTGTGTKFSGITISNNINATVNGDMAAIGDIWIDGNSKLTVNGSYAQSDGAFSSYGEVSIAGDCAFKQLGGISTYIGDSAIVRIGGSLTYDTSRGCTYSSGNGKWYNVATWYVAGDVSTGTGIGALYFTKLHLTGDEGRHALSMGKDDRIDKLWVDGDEKILISGNYFYVASLETDATVISKDEAAINAMGVAEGKTVNVEGNVNASGDIMVNKNATLNVAGNIVQSDKGLSVYENGKLHVNGNLEVCRTGYLYVISETAEVAIEGSLIYDSSVVSGNYMNGSFEVGGNVNSGTGQGTIRIPRLIVKGDGEHVISMGEKDALSGLRLDAGAKVTIDGYLNNTTIVNSMSLMSGEKAIYDGITVNDSVSLEINGDMKSIGNLQLGKSSSLTVSGDYIQSDDRLYLNGDNSSMKVAGNMTFSETGSIGYTGQLSRLSAGGDLTYSSVMESQNNLAKWSVDGSVSQGEDAGVLNFATLQMNTKGTSVTLPNGKIDKLILAGKLSGYTVTPADCYTILDEKGEPEIPVEPENPEPEDTADAVYRLILSRKSVQLYVGQSLPLNVTVIADKDVSSEVTWSSSDTSVITVENGIVKALSTGTGIVTATYVADETKTAQCVIRVLTDATEEEELDEDDKKAIEDSRVWIAGLKTEYPYTGSAIKPQVRIYKGNMLLTEGVDFTIAYTNNTKLTTDVAKPAKLTVKAKGNLSGSMPVGEFKIRALDLTSEASAEAITVAATGKANNKLKPILMMNGQKLKAGAKDVSYSYITKESAGTGTPVVSDCREAGEYVIRVTGSGTNYSGTLDVPLTVTADKIAMSTIKIRADKSSLKYTGSELSPKWTLSTKSAVLSAGKDYTVEGDVSATDPGTYTVRFSATDDSDYLGTMTASWKITGKKDLRAKQGDLTLGWIELNEEDLSATINGAAAVPFSTAGAKPAVTVSFDGKKLTEGVDYTVTYKKNKTIGKDTATVTVKGKGSYTGSISRSYSIGKCDLSSLTCVISDRVESNKSNDYKKTAIIWVSADGVEQKLRAGKDYTVDYGTLKTDKPAAGNRLGVTITAVENSNYTGFIKGSYRIISAKQDISKAKVTVNSGKPYAWTGDEVIPAASEISVMLGNVPVSSFDIIACYNNVSKGTATVVLRGNGSYAGIKAVKYKINAAVLR